MALIGHNSLAQNQVRITTNVLPPYSPYIQDYPGTGNRVQVFISNLSGKPLSVRLLGKLEGDNGAMVRTSTNYRPLRPLELRATDVNRLITRSDLEGLFDLSQIEVQGMDKNMLYRGLPLPEGNYQLCIQAFDNATIRPLSAEFPMGCSGLIPVRIIEPPILISPSSNEELIAKTPQTQLFTWAAPVGVLPSQVEYSIRVVELPNNDVDPNVYIDAMVLPRSGVEVNNLRTTTFIYSPQHPPLQIGKRYAWRVQAKPTGQRLHFLNDGKSPVQAFTYGAMQRQGVEIDYIAITQPDARKDAAVEIGANNPLNIKWKLDEEFEKILRTAFEAQPRKSLLEQFGELSYQVRIRTQERGNEGTVVLDRMVRTEYLKLDKSDLPANMPAGKKYQVQIELKGISDLRRKRASLGDGPLISKARSFSLVAKDKGNEADSLTIRGVLAYRFPGESGPGHILPNTKVALMKVFPNTFRSTVAYGKSDGAGNYIIKVLKTTLHGIDTAGVITRCLIDPVNPFIQPIAEPGYYQKSNENTFQISSAEQGFYDVQGITWLATGYTLDVTAKQSFKNWPGATDVNLEGKHLVIYRKPGTAKDYDKYRLPYEGQGEKQGKSSSPGTQTGVSKALSPAVSSGINVSDYQIKKENSVIANYDATKPVSAIQGGSIPNIGNVSSIVEKPGASGSAKAGNVVTNSPITVDSKIPSDAVLNQGIVNAAAAVTGSSTLKAANETDREKAIKQVTVKGYQFIGMAQVKNKGTGYGASFENLVYAAGSFDNYQIYCPDCGLEPDDADPVIFLQPKEKLAASPAKVEKYTYNIQTTEAPTMTFTGKLTYKFADAGKEGAQVKALGNTQVHLQVVYKDAAAPGNTYQDISINYSKYPELAAFHEGYSPTLDTKVTGSDGSFTFTVKMTKAMPLGLLKATTATGSGEFVTPSTTFLRGIRVVVDNPYYASPSDTYGTQQGQAMKPQGSYEFGPITAVVKSYTLVAQIKSDTTGISLVNKQKADIKSDLFGIKVSVLRSSKIKIGTPGPNQKPPADEGTGAKSTKKIKNETYSVIATQETDVNGLAKFPRMVMANGESDAYFLATESSVDGLNNYNLVTLKRITVSEDWGPIYSAYATQEEKERSDHAKKTVKNGAEVNCKKVWKVRVYDKAYPTMYNEYGPYTEAEYNQKKNDWKGSNHQWVFQDICDKANSYWLGDKLKDVKVNNSVLLNAGSSQASALFADQYKTFNSDVVKRFLAPGDPVVNVRVVDLDNPTQGGIKNAVVKLTYVPNGAFMGIPTTLTQYTGEDGWILTPFQLKPGTNAKVTIKADGYVYFNWFSDKVSPEHSINIGEVLLGQNSYYDRVLMQPNTVITGRALDADATGGPTPTGQTTINVGDTDASKKVVTFDKNTANNKVITSQVQAQVPASVFNSDRSLEAYAQADDGNMIKTKLVDGTWRFTLNTPSTASTLKIFPVNISYFGEEKNIKTQLPKALLGKNNLYTINAGDINIYERDHRISFKLINDINNKEIPGAYVRLFGKKDGAHEFGPSKADGLVETKFKNVSVENLFVEIAAPGYVTRTVSVKNEESKKAVLETIRLEPARTVNGIVVLKSSSGVETPLEGAEVFVAAGANAPIKYSTVSGKNGTFSLDVSKTFDGSSIKIETTYDKSESGNPSLPSGATYVGTGSSQLIPQPNGHTLKLTITTFDKFRISSIWGFPVTIEKIDPKTLQVTGEVDLSDTGLGPFAIVDKNVKVRFKNVVFKADPQNTSEGIPANETVELDAGILDNLLYHTSPSVNVNKAKYNIKLSPLDGQYGKLKIVKTPGTATGKIMAKAQVIDNSFNFSENLLSYEKGQFFLYDPEAPNQPSDRPVVTAFDASKNKIKWTNFGIAQENGAPMKLKLLDFEATSKLEGSRLIEDEIHLNPVMTCKIKDANPSVLKVNIGDLILKNNTVDAKTGETPLTFPLAGKWGVEIRDWKLDYKKGGFYSKSGVVKTTKADIPIKEFNLRSDFYNLVVEPSGTFELAGVAALKIGGKAYFGYDPQTGSDMKGHWAVVVVPEGNSPAAVLPAKSIPGLTQDMEFNTLSLLDNGEDVVSFGSGSKSFRYFNIIDVRPTTIETGSDYFAFDAGMSNAIPNAPQDVSMRFIYSKPQGGPVKLTTKIPGGYKLQTKGYLNFEAGQYVSADKSQTAAIFFADGVMAIRGSVEEPGKLLLDNILLVHNNNETHITHARNLDLTNESVLSKWKTSLADLTSPSKDDQDYSESGGFKRVSVSLGGNSNLSKVYCHQAVINKQWDLLKFSGLPQGFSKMLGEEEKNRLSFTSYGEIKAEGQKIQMDGIDTGMGGLSLVYDHQQKRLTGSMRLSNIPVPPTMTFVDGMAQVRLDGNGFYVVASGELQDIPLIVPVTMKAGLMLGVYTSNDLGDAKQVLFANSHRKELPCSFTSGFKGIYATGEVPVPLIGNFKQELSVPGVGGYKVGLDAYVDGYVFGNYDTGKFSVGGGLGVAAHAYAYGSLLSLSAGGEVHVNGGIDSKLTVNPGAKSVSVSMDSRLSAGFSVTLTEDLTGLDTGTSADFCLKLSGSASYTFGKSPDFAITPDCSFSKCNTDCLVAGSRVSVE